MAPPKSSPNSRRRGSTPLQDLSSTVPEITPQPGPSARPIPASDSNPPLPPGLPGVVAAIPMVHLPPHQESHPLTYGRLNSKEPAFFIDATVLQLKTILATAPPHLKPHLSANPTKAVLLNHLFRLRQAEAVAVHKPVPNHQENLTKLLSLSSQDIILLAQNDPTQLHMLMHSALLADPSLQPRNFSLSNATSLAGTAISWQLLSYKRAHELQQQRFSPRTDPSANPVQPRQVQFQDEPNIIDSTAPSDFPYVSPLHRPQHGIDNLARLLQPPAQQPQTLDDSSDDSDADTPRSAKKKSYVNPAGFTCGASAAIPQLLRAYPGKRYSSNSLSVKEMLGDRILCHWISSGIDVPTFLFHFRWKRPNPAYPTQAEMEANTLGRMIHLEMLTCPSPQQALDTRPSLEVGLRRLYAILFVEEGMNSGRYTDKGVAWNNIEFMLESHPNSSVMCTDISDEIARRIAMEKKRDKAVRSMEQQKASQRKRPHYPEPGGRAHPTTPPRRPNFRR